MAENGIRVAVVTGASGFVASELVKQLLEKVRNSFAYFTGACHAGTDPQGIIS